MERFVADLVVALIIRMQNFVRCVAANQATRT
jgi:hypothetical protein